MQSRMDKYNNNNTQVKSRTQKNHDLYESVRNSSLTEFDVNSNVSVIDNEVDVIDVGKVRRMLDKRYSDNAPRRRSIEIPTYEDPIIEEPLADTKEYDINAVIEKAKQGKNVDYTKERLRKIREAQYEILNNLDLEIKKVEEVKSESRKKEEENLMNLINTITELELKNRNNYNKQEVSEALDLLSDLKGDEEEQDDITEENDAIEVTTSVTTHIEEVKIADNSNEQKEEVKEDKTRDDHIEETLSKLDIDISAYDEFSDVTKNDAGSLILKIIIFAIIISLVVGGVYIIDNILELGLF